MTELLIPIGWHFVLGYCLLLVVWLGGLGWISCFSSQFLENDMSRMVYCYSAGLLGTIVTAIAISGSTSAALISPLLVGVPLYGFVSSNICRKRAIHLWNLSKRPAAISAPFIFCFGLLQGMCQHGPTASLAASPFGDLGYYVSRVISFRLFTYLQADRDLLSEFGSPIHVFGSAGPTLVASALSRLPAFDPFLFFAVSATAFFFCSVQIAFILLTTHTSDSVKLPMGIWLVLSLLLTETFPKPSAVVESVTYGVCLPLGFVMYKLVREDKLATRQFTSIVLTVLCCAFSTKVLAIFPLGVLAFVSLLRRGSFDLHSRASVFWIAGICFASFLYVFYFIHIWGIDRLVRHVNVLPITSLQMLLDGSASIADAFESGREGMILPLGQLVLVLGLFSVNRFVGLMVLLAGVGPMWVLSGTDVCFGISLIPLIAFLGSESRPTGRGLGLVAVGCILLIYYVWSHEVYVVGLRYGTATTILMVAINAVVVNWELGKSKHVGAFCFQAIGSLTVAVLLLIALTSDEMGTLRCKRWPGQLLTVDDYDIWSNVRKITPCESLIFTDRTGPEQVTITTGWNYYAATGERQLYQGGYNNSLVPQLEFRLMTNRAVLQGVVSPTEVSLRRDYESFFAVVTRNTSVPSHFRTIYENSSYRLYEIPTPKHQGSPSHER